MKKVVIIDDEFNARKTLILMLERYCEGVLVVGEGETREEGLRLIEEVKPDIVFLDVEMDGITGFDLMAEIGDCDFKVIFSTAHEKYAIKAIKYGAVDYLLKPLDPDELMSAVEKAKKQIDQKGKRAIVRDVSPEKKGDILNNRITIPTLDGLEVIDLRKIICCKAEDNYTVIHVEQQKEKLVSKTLKEFEDKLPSSLFFRIHQSSLVNLNYVEKYVKGEGGYVLMKDGTSMDVSRRKKIQFLEKLKGTWG
ncbi:MAG: two-component system LytT family response regulator [Sphingobacteriales bacterium]|jgi:two-component system LytT family response regulator